MAYEWLSRNAKSGYFVLNFDTQSVKLGFKNWLKNAPIFPISGGPVTFRPSLLDLKHNMDLFENADAGEAFGSL